MRAVTTRTVSKGRAALRRAAIASALALLAACATPEGLPAAPDAVETRALTTATGERMLQQSVVVPAPPAAVWRAWTTTEGFQAWAAPVANVDFRVGGIIEASYDPDAGIGAPGNIKNQIIAYVPGRMLAIRNVQAPPKVPFDAATFQTLQTVILLDGLPDGTTRVTVAQPGYRDGEAYEAVWRFFERGNAASLIALRAYLSRSSSR